jgi:hypothetical protein
LPFFQRIFHVAKIGFKATPLKKAKIAISFLFKICFVYFWGEDKLMKSLLILLFTVLIISNLSAQTTTSTLAVKETEHNFGKIPQGKPVYYNFEITNTGSVPLKLENVQASCGCTTPEWNKEAIAPGATDNIRVGYNAATEGDFDKFITITYNSTETKQIKIKGTVWKAPPGSAPANSSIQFLKQQMQ